MHEILACRHCGTRVMPTAEGDCPACRQRLVEVDQREEPAAEPKEEIAGGLTPDVAEEQPEVIIAQLAQDDEPDVFQINVGGSPLSLEPFARYVEPVEAVRVIPWYNTHELAVPPLPTHPVWTVIGYIALVFVASFLAGMMLAPMILHEDLQTVMRNAAAADSVVMLLLALGLANIIYERRVRQVLALKRPFLCHSLAVLALALPLMCVLSKGLDWLTGLEAAPVVALAQTMNAENPLSFHYVNDGLIAMASFPLPVVILIGCLLPAISEEIFFRGILGRILLGRFGTVAGVVLTSLLFAVMHLNLPQGCYTFFMGIALHIVYLTTRSLWLPMLLHAVNNLFAFLLVKFALTDSFHTSMADGSTYLPTVLLVVACCAMIALFGYLFLTRAYWLDGRSKRWSLGYATAESPPPELGATMQRTSSWWSGLTALGLCLLMAAAVAHTSKTWAALTYTRRAAALLEAQDFDQAEAAVAKAREYDPQLAWPLVIEAWFALQQEDFETALSLTDKVLCRSSSDYVTSWAHAIRGNAYLAMEKFDAAVQECSRSIDLDPNNANTFLDRAIAFSNLGEHEKSLADCNDVLRLDPENGDAFRIRAIAFVETGEHRKAVNDCNRALELTPSEFEDLIAAIHGTRGRANDALGHDMLAIADFTSALEQSPQEAWLLFARAMLHLRQEQFSQAIADFSRGSDVAPNDMAFVYHRAQAHMAAGQWSDAIEDLTLALYTFDGDASIYDDRATAYENIGDEQSASSDRETARMLRVTNSIRNGLEQVQLGRYEQAIASYTEAIELDGEHLYAYILRAQALAALERIDEALADYTAVISVDETQSDARLGRARLLFSRGEFEKTVDDYSVYLEYHPEVSLVYLERADALQARGRDAEAERDRQRCAELNGTQAAEKSSGDVVEQK